MISLTWQNSNYWTQAVFLLCICGIDKDYFSTLKPFFFNNLFMMQTLKINKVIGNQIFKPNNLILI